jgi:acyl-CoA reductase-like NAD-dependent aldehyde dehydrogenase
MAELLETGVFVDNAFHEASGGATFATCNPATGAWLADVAAGTGADVDAAVVAADRAFERGWSSLAVSDRARLLRRAADLLASRREELASIEARDVGKPITDCRAEVDLAVEWFEFFADIGLRLRTAVIPGVPAHLNYTLRHPIGVAALVTPWNYPLAIYGFKVPAALATGNTVVLKPAEQAPLSALALAALLRDAGFPAGVFNVVTGDGPGTGASLVGHEKVATISFTGSTSVGRQIAQRAGGDLKRYTLELGGKSPNIIFEDADLDAAVSTSVFTYTVNQGQLCTAGTRLLVQDRIVDRVVDAIVDAGRALRIGDPLDPRTQLGSLIDEVQLERVEGYVSQAVEDGAEIVTGGHRPDLGAGLSTCFYTPTVLAGLRPASATAQEEIFGPVVTLLPFSTEDDAIRIANGVRYGLAAGIWTSDLSRALRLAHAIDAGLIWINTMHVLSPGSPYGGVKDSGVGVEGGLEQAEEYTRQKSVWINYGSGSPRYE